MKPESADFLGKAHRLLNEASIMLDADLAEAAGRTAYLAGFHAAQAMIFERDDRSAKAHDGVHPEFARLMKGTATSPPIYEVFSQGPTR